MRDLLEEIENYILSKNSGNLEELNIYILGISPDTTPEQAEKISTSVLKDMKYRGLVRLLYEEQKEGSPVFEVVG